MQQLGREVALMKQHEDAAQQLSRLRKVCIHACLPHALQDEV